MNIRQPCHPAVLCVARAAVPVVSQPRHNFCPNYYNLLGSIAENPNSIASFMMGCDHGDICHCNLQRPTHSWPNEALYMTEPPAEKSQRRKGTKYKLLGQQRRRRFLQRLALTGSNAGEIRLINEASATTRTAVHIQLSICDTWTRFIRHYRHVGVTPIEPSFWDKLIE